MSYKRQSHLNKVIQASNATLGTLNVLQFMCHHSAFDRPEVTLTRPQVEKGLRLGRSTVLKAYRFLKNEGTIEATQNAVGGKGNAVTFAIKVIGQGGREGLEDGGAGPQEETPDPKTFAKLVKKHGQYGPAMEAWRNGDR